MHIRVILATFVVFAVAGARGVTIGELEKGLCPTAREALGSPDFSTLKAAIDAVSGQSVDIPANTTVALVAPNNAAFDSYLTAAGLTPAEALANTDLLLNTLGAHIAYANNGGASQGDTPVGSKVRFMLANGTKVAINEVVPGDMAQGSMNKVTVTDVIDCVLSNTYVFAVDGVLKPKETAAPIPETEIPATSPEAMPAAVPEEMPATVPEEMPAMVPEVIPAAVPEEMPEMMPPQSPEPATPTPPSPEPSPEPVVIPAPEPVVIPAPEPVVIPAPEPAQVPATAAPGPDPSNAQALTAGLTAIVTLMAFALA